VRRLPQSGTVKISHPPLPWFLPLAAVLVPFLSSPEVFLVSFPLPPCLCDPLSLGSQLIFMCVIPHSPRPVLTSIRCIRVSENLGPVLSHVIRVRVWLFWSLVSLLLERRAVEKKRCLVMGGKSRGLDCQGFNG